MLHITWYTHLIVCIRICPCIISLCCLSLSPRALLAFDFDNGERQATWNENPESRSRAAWNGNPESRSTSQMASPITWTRFAFVLLLAIRSNSHSTWVNLPLANARLTCDLVAFHQRRDGRRTRLFEPARLMRMETCVRPIRRLTC